MSRVKWTQNRTCQTGWYESGFRSEGCYRRKELRTRVTLMEGPGKRSQEAISLQGVSKTPTEEVLKDWGIWLDILRSVSHNTTQEVPTQSISLAHKIFIIVEVVSFSYRFFPSFRTVLILRVYIRKNDTIIYTRYYQIFLYTSENY